MAEISPEVMADITSRSYVFGGILGILCIPTAFFAGTCGACCPVGQLVGVLPVTWWAFWSGLLAAMFLDWNQIGHAEGLTVGVQVGARTGFIASAIGAVATFAVSSFFLGTVGLAGAADGSAEAMAGAGSLVVMNGLAAGVAMIPGTLLGILGGVFGAAIKRK